MSHLSWQDHHEHFFLIAAQHVLHKGPSRADQDYCEEQKTTLKYLLRFFTELATEIEALGQRLAKTLRRCVT